MISARLTATAAAAFIVFGGSALGQAIPYAHVSSGELAGSRESGVTAFLGVPYAAPPVGHGRWRPPEPASAWRAVRPADRFAPSCVQALTPDGVGPWAHEFMVHGRVSEDCLYLNVWTPASAGARLPVMLWIHGGAFVGGSGSVPIYNGAALAASGVVVVTINYRLGVFGFLAHPDLTRESGSAPPTNFGLQDMIAALRWVHDNIKAFGGDPDRVTIAGESAGSIAVNELLTSPLATGLFVRAIAQSGLPSIAPPLPLAAAEAIGVKFARSKHVTNIEQLRSLTADELLSGQPVDFWPSVDGKLLPGDPARLVEDGQFNDTPVLVGINADENSAINPGYGKGDPVAFGRFLKDTYGSMASRFAVLYPANSDQGRAAQSKAMFLDNGLASIYAWAHQRKRHGRAPIYVYLYTHVEPGPESTRYGVFHSSGLPYIFGTLDAAPERQFKQMDRTISSRLSSCWVNFIRNGDPNGSGLPAAWPEFDPDTPQILELGETIRTRPLLSPEKLEAEIELLARGGQPKMF